MSFGFSVGDILAAGSLAWTLYNNCYKVARGAPEEFRLLLGEISNVSNSLRLLNDEIHNPDSVLVRAGQERVQMVNDMVSRVQVTLTSLQKVAKEYEVLQSTSKGKHVWKKFKWSIEFSNLDSLRNKVRSRNSSLQRKLKI
jgi:hypothetical protein